MATQRPGFAAYGGANAFEPPLGKPLAGKRKRRDRHGVGGGVLSAKPAASDPLSAYLKKQKSNGGS